MPNLAPELDKAYREELHKQRIPFARRSYYTRWLYLYFAACEQNAWSPDTSRHIEPFISTIRDRHPSAFLQQQAREAIQIYYRLPVPDSGIPVLTPQQVDEQRQLDTITLRIKACQQRSVEDIITVGTNLHQAKSLLQHGRFKVWLKAEFELSYQTANRMMNVAVHFSGKSLTVRLLSLRSLYALAAPTTSPSVRAEVLSRLESGERLTHEQIMRMIRSHGPPSQRDGSASLARLNLQLVKLIDQARQTMRNLENIPLGQNNPDLIALRQRLNELSAILGG